MSYLRRPTGLRYTNKKQKRYHQFGFTFDSNVNEMAFFAPSSTTTTTQYLAAPPAPSRKRSQRFQRPRDDVDEFLSSDLELSFASSISLHSPQRQHSILNDSAMDISPAPPQPTPVFTLAPPKNDTSSRPKNRPRAFTSGARIFGKDMSNGLSPAIQLDVPSISKSGGSQSAAKRTQRSALPFEWLASVPSPTVETPSLQIPIPQEPSSDPIADDAMDVDTIVPGAFLKAALPSSPPLSAAPTITSFNNLFYDTMSPRRSSADSPAGPLPKKRRSHSPESLRSARRAEVHDVSSSPAPPSSPSQRKFERISSGPMLSKPLLQGVGAPPSKPNKRIRRPVLSAMVNASDACQLQTAYPIVSGDNKGPSNALPPPRRAVSAMLVPTAVEPAFDESLSFDGPDMSSPAQMYAQRKQVKTLKRCDGTLDFRSWTGASALVARDANESPSVKTDDDTARAKFGGVDEKEGKVLPCKAVREDGLMRITHGTMDALLDGVFDDDISSYQVVDCRFDYEFNGGHIAGAVNIQNPTEIEDYFLGSNANKPKQTQSGGRDKAIKKKILIFHCEFSAKRAPTLAKHLRSRDRAMNNHVYPRLHFPEVYILEGGYCEYFKNSAKHCEPRVYITMDDPDHAVSRREDLDQLRKGKFGRTKSYTYGDGVMKMNMMTAQQVKRNTAPSGGSNPLFAAANAARTRRGGALSTLAEDGNTTAHSEDEDTDIGDSPCPPPTKASAFKGKKLGRAPLMRAETYGPSRMTF